MDQIDLFEKDHVQKNVIEQWAQLSNLLVLVL